MEERTEYQVLVPKSVAFYILAGLVADRSGNELGRDLALAEAQRIAEQRRLMDQLAPLPRYDVAHECNGVRLAELERMISRHARNIEDLDDQRKAMSARLLDVERALVMERTLRRETDDRLTATRQSGKHLVALCSVCGADRWDTATRQANDERANS